MKLFDYIYEFLTEHIFVNSGQLGNLSVSVGNDQNLKLYEWLSTTASIVILCLIVAFLILFVRWLFRLTSGLIRGN